MKEPRLLVVVPCGKAKIWDRHPEAGATSARNAYTGSPFLVNRSYAEHFATRWVILSAKYGFIDPGFLIPGPYNLTFKKKHPALVTPGTLREQVIAHGMTAFADVIVLGGKEYRRLVEEAFVGVQTRIHCPFAGLGLGPAMSATNEAVATGDPFYRKGSPG